MPPGNVAMYMLVCSCMQRLPHVAHMSTHTALEVPLLPPHVLAARDFFIWSAIKAGSSLVSAGGPSQRSGLEWRADAADLQR
jgi:hypothetical protein